MIITQTYILRETWYTKYDKRHMRVNNRVQRVIKVRMNILLNLYLTTEKLINVAEVSMNILIFLYAATLRKLAKIAKVNMSNKNLINAIS